MTNIPSHEIAALARRQLQHALSVVASMKPLSSNEAKIVSATAQIAASLELIDLLAVDRRVAVTAATYAEQLWCEGPNAQAVGEDLLAAIIAENGEA